MRRKTPQFGDFVVNMAEVDTVEQPLKVTAEQLGVREGCVLAVKTHTCMRSMQQIASHSLP